MDLMQNDITKKFIREVEALIKSGKEPTYKAIAEKLNWHNNSMSMVKQGLRDVPPEIYKKFAEIYKPSEVRNEGVLYEIALYNQAVNRVLLRALAEILSNSREESVTKTLGELEAAVKVEIQQVSERLR